MAEWLQPGDLHSPDWLLAGFDTASGVYHFAAVDRETYSESPFLDHRMRPVPQRLAQARVVEVDQWLAGSATAASRPCTWVLHTAFCASTLLASCLDWPGRSLALKEPLVLSRLAQDRRRSQLGPAGPVQEPGWVGHARRVLALSERSYGAEQALVKPSNFANALVPELLGTGSAHRRFILISSSLQELLVSVLKKSDEAEQLMPGFLSALLQDSDYLERLGPLDVQRLDLLQQSTVFWHCQRHQLDRLRTVVPENRLLRMTMRRFFDDPAGQIDAAARFARLGLAKDEVGHIVRDKVLSRHAKEKGSTYSPRQHREDAQRLADQHRLELERTLDWAQDLFERLPPPAFPGEG
jgi:hypothetical protein